MSLRDFSLLKDITGAYSKVWHRETGFVLSAIFLIKHLKHVFSLTLPGGTVSQKGKLCIGRFCKHHARYVGTRDSTNPALQPKQYAKIMVSSFSAMIQMFTTRSFIPCDSWTFLATTTMLPTISFPLQLTTKLSSNSALGHGISSCDLGHLLGTYPLERWVIWRLSTWGLRNGIDLHRISHLAWAPTWLKPHLQTLMTSAGNWE